MENLTLPKLLMDEYNLKILSATTFKPRSARELSYIFGIPLAGILAALFFHILRTRGASGTVAERTSASCFRVSSTPVWGRLSAP